MSGAIQPAFQIRPMRLEDVPRVHEIDRLSFNLPWPERSYRFEVSENDHSSPWVVETVRPDGPGGSPEVVAMMVNWIIIDEAHIATIAVHPDYRRRKIAEQILLQAFDELYKEGVLKVFLEVRRSNEAALTLYRRLGFIEDGIRKRYYKDNQEDDILMEMPDLGTLFHKEHDDGSI